MRRKPPCLSCASAVPPGTGAFQRTEVLSLVKFPQRLGNSPQWHNRRVGSSSPLELGEAERLLRHRLHGPRPGADAQRRFAPVPAADGWAPDLRPAHARHAAALLLLFPGLRGTTVPLTRRRADLPQHPGQVSLPGGAIDAGESADAAALRETREELGVTADGVRLIGALSPLWVPVSNFVVHPFVGVADKAPAFEPHPGEVDALVEAPLSLLLDAASVKWTRWDRRGRDVDVPYFDVDGHVVWGATAMILGEFVCLFDPDRRPPAPPGR